VPTKLQSIIRDRLDVALSQITEFCQRWKIVEFALFGSVLREDFRPNSDVDVLITLAPNHGWSLFNWIDMQQELEAMFQRQVDLVDKQGLVNPYRRAEIMRTYQVIYASEQS
jgi:predicted nucleotidyltransferase